MCNNHWFVVIVCFNIQKNCLMERNIHKKMRFSEKQLNDTAYVSKIPD